MISKHKQKLKNISILLFKLLNPGCFNLSFSQLLILPFIQWPIGVFNVPLVCMYIHVHMCVSVHVCVYMCASVSVHVLFKSLCACVCMMCVHACAYMCVCFFVCLCVHAHLCVYVCVCISRTHVCIHGFTR